MDRSIGCVKSYEDSGNNRSIDMYPSDLHMLGGRKTVRTTAPSGSSLNTAARCLPRPMSHCPMR